MAVARAQGAPERAGGFAADRLAERSGKRGLAMKRLAVTAIVTLMTLPTLARDNGQWGGVDPAVRQWFQSLRQPDHPRLSCCGEADAFEADNFEVENDHYVAVITDGEGVIPNGTRIAVPNWKMKFDSGNPTGHGIIFIGTQGQIYCYVTPGGV